MKKDINFLECIINEEQKKESSIVTAVAVVGVFFIICLMGFLFFNAKMDIKKNEENIKMIEDEKSTYNRRILISKKRYDDVKTEFEDIFNEASPYLAGQKLILATPQFTNDIIDTLFYETITLDVENKEQYFLTDDAEILIKAIKFESGNIVVSASTYKNNLAPSQYIDRLRNYEIFSEISYKGAKRAEEKNNVEIEGEIVEQVTYYWEFEFELKVNGEYK